MRFYIETERLIMRDLLAEDAEGMFVMDSDADVHKYVGGRPVQTIEQTKSVIDLISAQYESNGIGRWAVIEKSTGSFVRWSGLKLITEPINGHVNYYDLGYRFVKSAWGRGYATETAHATVQYAWDVMQLNELNAIANIDNAASRRVLEKTGMQQDGTFLYDGSEHVWYELIKPTKLSTPFCPTT